MCDSPIVPDQDMDFFENAEGMKHNLTNQIINSLIQQLYLCLLYLDMDWNSHEDMKFCSYCFDAKEPLAVYQTHYMYTLEGNVECPKLRREGCPKCGETGDKSHVTERCYKMRMNYKSRRCLRPKRKMPSLRVQLLKKLTARAIRTELFITQETI